MKVHTGTSGYSYKEWKGTFYPEDLPAAKMLAFYAGHFDTVEINNTFYRMPEAKMLEKWAGDVPDRFVFVLKAPQRITHQKRLVDAGDDVRHFFEVASVLGSKLGPVLFQLPPFAKKDAAKLNDFLRILPPGQRFAFEFRHASWFDDETYDALRQKNAALCAADTDEVADPESILTPTADWGYLRLRRTHYGDGDLSRWAKRVMNQTWSDAFVFFKHEDEGKGPIFAREFMNALVPPR